MRKITLTTLISILVFAQSPFAQVRVGVEAGMNFTSLIRIENNMTSLDAAIRSGYHLGGNLEVPLVKDLYVQPGLFFSTKGFRKGWASEMDAEAYYIEAPVAVIYKLRFGPGKLLLGAGPYLAYGTGGKWHTPQRWAATGGGSTNLIFAMDGSLEFANDASYDNYHFIAPGSVMTYGKPFDYGVTGLIGYELFDKFSLRFSGQYGVANIAPKVDGQKTTDEIRNSGLGLSLAYFF